MASIGASCGGDGAAPTGLTPQAAAAVERLPDHEQAPAIAAFQLQKAFAKRNWTKMCASITENAAIDAGSTAHGFAIRCDADLQRFVDLIEDGNGFVKHDRPLELLDVQADGDRATVRVAWNERWPTDMNLVKQDGRWKLDEFIGSRRSDIREISQSRGRRPFPSPGRGGVRVIRADGKPCSRVRLREGRYGLAATGGCKMRIRGEGGHKLPTYVHSGLGEFKFANCRFDVSMRVSGDGTAWIDDIAFERSAIENLPACIDIKRCKDPARGVKAPPDGQTQPDDRPWRDGKEVPLPARIRPVADETFSLHVDVCFQTCVGDFVGQLQLQISNGPTGWVGFPVDPGVGTSGFRFGGRVAIRTDGADIRAAKTG